MQQRVTREISAEQALALARNEYRRRVALLEDTRSHLEEIVKTAANKEADLFGVMQLSFYSASVTRKINSQEKAVNEAGFAVERKREEAVEARRGRQVIEKIKERKLEDFKRDEIQRELKELDELALYAFQRRKRQKN